MDSLQSVSLLDWLALEKKLMGNDDFLVRLLAAILSDHAGTLERLNEAIAAEDIETVAFIAHQIKGVAGNVVATAICEQARVTEKAARARNAEALILAKQLAGVLGPFFKALQARVEQG